jgi:hypothetical protein
MWDQLDDLGLVEDAEGMDRFEQVPQLVDRIKQWMSAARSMTAAPRPAVPDRPSGAAASARIDALSAIYAAWADTDPSLTPEQVAGIYARLRGKLHDDPPRSLSLKYCQLAEHVGPHVQFYTQEPGKVRRAGRRPAPGPTGLAQFIDPATGYSWATLHRGWNAKHADPAEKTWSWRYEHLSNFTRDAQSALTRLLNPGWRMWDQ